MAERSKNSPSSSRRITKLKFRPKPPNPNKKKARATSSTQPQAEDKPAIDKDILTKLRTRSAVRKTAAGTGDGSNEQKPQPSSQADLQAEAKNWNKYGPYIVLPMRPDNTNSEELNKQEFGQTSLTSSVIEASINSAKVLGLEKEGEQNRMLLFQFPKSLPYEIRTPNAEEADGKGKMKPKTIGCNLQQLPAGYVGKMLVYKSGKVKMKLGNVIFDVNPGVTRNFEEHAVAINTKEGHLCKLGNIEQHSAVVTPDVDALLEGTKN